MLNFRRLKKDFSPSILDKGKDLHAGKMVRTATILAVDSDAIRVGASIQGNFENVHECEVEIDRLESEIIHSNCDCSYQYDCQHLAALFLHLEDQIDGLLISFVDEAGLEDDDGEELKEVIEKAQAKEEARQGKKHEKEVLAECAYAAKVLGGSAFFVPDEEIEVDRAEFTVMLDLAAGPLPQFSLALRLPYRSKPLHIPHIGEFVEAIRYREPLWISGRRYYFTLDSFSEGEREIAKRILEGASSIDEGRKGQLESHTFGMVLARAYELACDGQVAYGGETMPLPCLYLGTLETPLHFSPAHAALRFDLEYLELPTPKIFLQPAIVLDEGSVSLEEVCLFKCRKPGLIANNTYYRFQERVKRHHLKQLETIRDMTVPEPLFGSLVENALPAIQRIAEVANYKVVERFPTMPFVGELRARCHIEYLDGELDARLYFLYDDVEIPAAPTQQCYEDVSAFVSEGKILARDLVAERKLTEDLFQGFIYQKQEGSFAAKSEKKIVEFMTSVVPKYQDRIDFECPENLREQFLYDTTKFELAFTRGDEVDGYQVKLKVNGDLKGISLDRLWESIVAKRTFIELEKKGKKASRVLVLDLERLAPVVQLFEELGVKVLKDHSHKCPLWSLAHLDVGRFKDLPIEMTISDDLFEIQQQMLGAKPIVASPIPDDICGTLRGYQLEGVHWLERLRQMHLSGILADDMGLGKTFQTIIAITQYQATHPCEQSLIVCPTSLLYNWQEEFHKFNPEMKVLVVDGTPAQRKKTFEKSGDYNVLITSYSLLQKDIGMYGEVQFGYAVLDEAQNIKNRGTRNAKSVKMVKARHRVVLTGTPVENSLDELWSLFDFLMPGLLSSYDRFVERYIRNTRASRIEKLSAKVAPFILRRMKADVLDDLPPVSQIVYHCHLSEVQKELYQSYATSAREELARLVKKEGFDRVQIHVLATLTRLKQICCHPAIFAKDKAEPGDSAKYDMLLELLQSLIEGNHKTVIFSQYTGMLGIMRNDLERLGIRFSYLDGSSKNRLELVKEFNGDPNISVFLVSLKAGGTGLNLVGADTVIHYDMWWNPAVENQATDRVHRIGQERSVSAYKLVTLGTIEEKILELQKRKEGLVKSVISCDDEVVAKLTWEEVLELLQVDAPVK